MRCSKWLALKEKCTSTRVGSEENRQAVQRFVDHCRACFICQDQYSYLVAMAREEKQKEVEER